MSQNFEVTKDGIKVSYVRFLSDSAAGYILLLLFGVAYLLRQPLPLVGTSWVNIIPAQPSSEVKVFLFLISFLIATPLGLILNGVGWFLLGTPVIKILNLWVSPSRLNSFFTTGTRRAYLADRTGAFFEVDSPVRPAAERLYEQMNFYEEILKVRFASYFTQLEAVRGLRRFTRSLALIFLAVSIYCFLWPRELYVGLLAMFGFVFFLLLNSLLEYYQGLKVLFMVYSLSSKLHSQKSPPSRQSIVDNLTEVSEKLRAV